MQAAIADVACQTFGSSSGEAPCPGVAPWAPVYAEQQENNQGKEAQLPQEPQAGQSESSGSASTCTTASQGAPAESFSQAPCLAPLASDSTEQSEGHQCADPLLPQASPAGPSDSSNNAASGSPTEPQRFLDQASWQAPCLNESIWQGYQAVDLGEPYKSTAPLGQVQQQQAATSEHSTADISRAHWRKLLRPGMEVNVYGLTSEAGRQLNGCVGTVLGFDDESDRYMIRFAGQGNKRLKAENLRRAAVDYQRLEQIGLNLSELTSPSVGFPPPHVFEKASRAGYCFMPGVGWLRADTR